MKEPRTGGLDAVLGFMEIGKLSFAEARAAYYRLPMRTKLFMAVTLGLFALLAQADQVIMNNGDHYHGKVSSLTTNSLILQSDVLGTVNLSRTKVAQIIIGSDLTTTSKSTLKPTDAPVLKTNAGESLTTAVRQLKTQPDLIQQVQTQYLNDASPEAKAKFDQMLSDLSNGKMSVGDLRTEAKSAADQLRSLRKELGEEAGDGIDGYLAILDNFVQESTSATGTTNIVVTPKAPIQPASEKK